MTTQRCTQYGTDHSGYDCEPLVELVDVNGRTFYVTPDDYMVAINGYALEALDAESPIWFGDQS